MMKHTCNGEHRWPVHPESVLSAGWGSREVWTCKKCLATKVVILTDQADGTFDRVVQVARSKAGGDRIGSVSVASRTTAIVLGNPFARKLLKELQYLHAGDSTPKVAALVIELEEAFENA